MTPGGVLADRWACCHSGGVWVEAVEGGDLAPVHLWPSPFACTARGGKKTKQKTEEKIYKRERQTSADNNRFKVKVTYYQWL